MNKSVELLELVKEHLSASGCSATVEAIEAEIKAKSATELKDTEKQTQLHKIALSEKEKAKKINILGEKHKQLDKKHKGVLSCARQIFSIVINCLQQLHNIKDVFS